VSRSTKTSGPPRSAASRAAIGKFESTNPAMFCVVRMIPLRWSSGPGAERPAAAMSLVATPAAPSAARLLARSAATTAVGPVCGVGRPSRPMSVIASPSMRTTAVRTFVPPRSMPR